METKIFGIGLGKTGTHSLCRAMSVLGYRAEHHPSAYDLAKSIYGCDFLNDIIIAWQFEFLDHNFPGSKFILCTRELEDWLESYRNTKTGHGSFYTRQSRFMLYGCTEFIEHKFIRAHIDYHVRVFNYFAKRKEDLLVMNICKGDGWEKLCKWVNKPVPDVPFPKEGSWKTRQEREK